MKPPDYRESERKGGGEMSKEIEITKEDLEKIRQEGLRVSAEITKSMKRMSVHDTIPELKREIDRLTAALKKKEAECERWHKAFTHYHVNNGVLEESHRAVNAQLKIEGKRAQDMANLAASRLADQEAIERHTEQRVAREIKESATEWFNAKCDWTPEGRRTCLTKKCADCFSEAVLAKYLKGEVRQREKT